MSVIEIRPIEREALGFVLDKLGPALAEATDDGAALRSAIVAAVFRDAAQLDVNAGCRASPTGEVAGLLDLIQQEIDASGGPATSSTRRLLQCLVDTLPVTREGDKAPESPRANAAAFIRNVLYPRLANAGNFAIHEAIVLCVFNEAAEFNLEAARDLLDLAREEIEHVEQQNQPEDETED